MNRRSNLEPSFVYFRDSKVMDASNDGMELLGHFLISQVGADRTAFFSKWLNEKVDDSLSSGPYYIEKLGDSVQIDHLENKHTIPFETSRKNMLDVLQHWHGWCAHHASSACGIGGNDVSITRLLGDYDDFFEFHTHKIH